MKKTILIAIVVSIGILFNGCKKDNTIEATLEGTWELRQEQSGMSAAINYSAGFGNLLKIAGNKYTFYANGQIVRSGTYSIKKDADIKKEVCLETKPNEFANRIIYDGNINDQKIFLQINGSSLTFLSGCFAVDAGSYKKYEKINVAN